MGSLKAQALSSPASRSELAADLVGLGFGMRAMF